MFTMGNSPSFLFGTLVRRRSSGFVTTKFFLSKKDVLTMDSYTNVYPKAYGYNSTILDNNCTKGDNYDQFQV